MSDTKTGSFSLESITLLSGQKPTPTEFHIFNPAPVEGYEEKSRYSPGIIMERGQRVYEDGTGIILHDSERFFVRRSTLESVDQHDEKKLETLLNLVRIERHFEDYKKTIEALKRNEQNQ
ncbi:hypothetical protein HYU82_02535 [Candidatus Saccharibacteria bacterium]|nr:hypothetical protein [Candidatus Saccharibacteria bacterium]